MFFNVSLEGAVIVLFQLSCLGHLGLDFLVCDLFRYGDLGILGLGGFGSMLWMSASGSSCVDMRSCIVMVSLGDVDMGENVESGSVL